jgi:Pseudouridylate synthases, 23S RNA-specific
MKLAEQFKVHSISRKYPAITLGSAVYQTIEGYIGKNKINRKKMSLNLKKNGKISKTEIKLLNLFKILLYKMYLPTGRITN